MTRSRWLAGSAAVALPAAFMITSITAPSLANGASGASPAREGERPSENRDTAYTTAKGMPSPLVVSHRGASGYRPEHTAAAYELAAAMGADYIEPDLVMTRDGQLVDRHEPEISGTTNVASHPEFATRKTTKLLDGVPTTGWFTEDFTLAELKTLRCVERLPQLRQHNTLYDGRYQITTYAEDLRLREALSKKYRRTIGIIPEIKHSTYFHKAGFDPEAATVALTKKYGLNTANAPMWIQSFELTNMISLRTKFGYRANETFLTTAAGGPFDLVSAGDNRTYADLTTAASLKKLSKWINGIGPEKAQIIPRTPGGSLTSPTTLVADAHAAGLKVVPWTFRAENDFLPTDYRVGANPADYGRAIDEIVTFLRTGIDGFFTDQSDIGVEARAEFLATQ